MTDILLIFTSILVGFLVGNRYAKQCRDKYILFCDLERFAQMVSQNAKGKCLPLVEVFSQYQSTFSQDFNDLFQNCFVNSNSCSLKNLDEKINVDNFFALLKQPSAKEVYESAKSYQTIFANYKNSSDAIYKTKGIAMQKLGVLLGVCFGLMIV